jgi:hypothetical protein
MMLPVSMPDASPLKVIVPLEDIDCVAISSSHGVYCKMWTGHTMPAFQ